MWRLPTCYKLKHDFLQRIRQVPSTLSSCKHTHQTQIPISLAFIRVTGPKICGNSQSCFFILLHTGTEFFGDHWSFYCMSYFLTIHFAFHYCVIFGTLSVTYPSLPSSNNALYNKVVINVPSPSHIFHTFCGNIKLRWCYQVFIHVPLFISINQISCIKLYFQLFLFPPSSQMEKSFHLFCK